MTPQESLLAYLYPRLVEALQTWKGFNDIYGIWIGLILSEDYPCRPSINVIGCLRESTLAEKTGHGDRWSPGWMNPIISFKPSLCDDPYLDEDDDTADYDPESLYPGDPEGRNLRDMFFQWRQEQLDTPQVTNNHEAFEQRLTWFLGICGSLIHKLHETGAIVETCGRPVPVGFGIGDGGTRTLEIVRANNPDRISKGMEEWMMGETYAEIDAFEAFSVEVFAWPLEQQARFYVQGAIGYHGEKRGLSSTPEWEWAREKGRPGMGLNWRSPAAHLFLGELLPELEKRATARWVFPRGTYPEAELAEHLISSLHILRDNLATLSSPIPEADIDRLHALLQRLYDESKKEERIGVALQLTARALHALRPERFPVVKFGGRRENANRLLEPEKFGLK